MGLTFCAGASVQDATCSSVCLLPALQMVRLLVQAGANVNARLHHGAGVPAIAHALYSSRMEPPDAEILQILIGKTAVSVLPGPCFIITAISLMPASTP